MAEFTITTDLSVISSKPIEANFDEALAAVKAIVAPYQALVVTEDAIRGAKKDRADLNALKARLDEYRKTVKAAYNKPVDEFTERMKPIYAEIDAAVGNIDGQVKAFEAAEVERKIAGLRAYFESQLRDESRGIADWDKLKSRNPKWTNKTYSEGQAHTDIQTYLLGIERDMNALRAQDEKYRAVAIEEYRRSGNIADALQTIARIKAREQQEAERQRREEEARRAAEEAERERREREEAARAARTAQELSNSLSEQLPAPPAETPAQPTVAPEAPKKSKFPARVEFWVIIQNGKQAAALGAFLRENGIEYGAINREG